MRLLFNTFSDLNSISQGVKQQENSGILKQTVQAERIAEIIQEFEGRVHKAYERCKV